ncbi:MAG: nucleotide sugar dehydrogenase [Promethearchaeota archaeon]
MNLYSISPNNEKYKLPDKKDTIKEISRIMKICEINHNKNKKIVVVQGLGFVGSIMAAVVADCEINNRSPYFVIGIDLPTQESFWKIAMINSGRAPFNVGDPSVSDIFKRTVIEKKTLTTTWVKKVYKKADIIIVDINLDVIKLEKGNSRKFQVNFSAFKNAIKDIGLYMRPDSLILIETTVPPGTIKKIVLPIIKNCFKQRKIDVSKKSPLIAYSYERVMPGKKYISSVKNFWRTISGINELSLNLAEEFLSTIIDVKKYPLTRLKSTTATELAKILENSYRAVNIAFIYEWTLLAEDLGINLFEVIDSIRVRKGTHDNMMYPGFGVGGYCLPKDTFFAEWSSKEFFSRKVSLDLSLKALNINELMPHHTFQLLEKYYKGNIKGKVIIILGASYREEVDDTRNSPSIVLYDDIIKRGGVVYVHDPYAKKIIGRDDIKIYNNFEDLIKKANAIIFTVRHNFYKELSMEYLISLGKNLECIIDANNLLSDKKIKFLKSKKIRVLGVGKGHIEKL